MLINISDSQNVTYNGNVRINCTFHSVAPLNITWTTTASTEIVQQPIPQLENDIYTSILTLTGVTLNNSGIYTCNAVNEGGMVSTTSTLNVLGKLLIHYILIVILLAVPVPIVTVTPQNLSLNYSSSMNITCTSISVMQPSIMWTTDTGINLQQPPVVNTGNDEYTSVLLVNGIDDIAYTCISSNVNGSANDTSTVSVISESIQTIQETFYFFPCSIKSSSIN